MVTMSCEYARAYAEKRPLYWTWATMKQRCTNPSAANYANYGGRGITVCDRWMQSSWAFEEDMGPRPEGCTLERIDNDGPYSPENCRWMPAKSQARNKRTNRMLTFRGRTQSIAAWADEVGISRQVIGMRLRKGEWSVENALTTPVRGAVR